MDFLRIFGWFAGVVAAVACLYALAMCAGSPAHAETCIASVYGVGDRDQNGTRTASGIPLSNAMPTIAHRTLPLKSWAWVTNLRTGQRHLYQVTDRGPFVRSRCVDLSRQAAKMIGVRGLGHVSVKPEQPNTRGIR